MEIDFKYVLIILVAGLNLAVGILILLNNPKNKNNIFFGLANFCLAIWTFLVFVFHTFSREEYLQLLFRLQIFMGMLIVLFLYIFSGQIF